MSALVLKQVFSGLASINEVKNAIAEVTDVSRVSDLRKRIEAARKYDNDTAERRNYWGELAIWSERRIGELLIESKENGEIKHGGDKKQAATLAAWLGTETDAEAQHISSRSQRLAAFKPEEIEEAIEAIKDDGEEVSKAAVKRKLVGAHVGHNSGENEWYTPTAIIEHARNVMGSIDLDPATSVAANEIVKASQIYTVQQDGLSKKWTGNVWMNPPYARNLVDKFVLKLIEERDVSAYCVLVNNSTETKWFQALAKHSDCICFPSPRVQFWDPSGKVSQPLQGQAILYRGDNSDAFDHWFSDFGFVVGKLGESE